jgi:ATP-dependent Clp protease adaptor protein ClpS
MAESMTVPEIEINIGLGKPYNVILFNDESHEMMEVCNQIVKAIHCETAQAVSIMMQAHQTGRAIVITAGLERCEHVQAVLEEIRLGTKIEPA